MDKIIILYYSGVGNTKRIAQYMYNYLKRRSNVDIYSIEELPTDFSFNKYSKLIIGFPTIHAEPATPMMHFVRRINARTKKLPTFVYTTYGLYSGNAIRIFCELAIVKNIIPVYTNGYRAPAIDGILLTPKIKRWHSYEKGLSIKIKNDVGQFLNTNEDCAKIPKLKWYSVFNYPNKLIGKHTKLKIYLHENKCVKCGVCTEKCPAGACTNDASNLPIFDITKCINCYRCIHHCPQRALSLSKSGGGILEMKLRI